ncbi:uncharacterized protein whip [Drosophila kikkawai]|uniref:Uncharacterized protein whip n=1 Tax=Drosophila kikkawai TaxID=30033 RepID=A0A6P4I326_DROKI|nr:uncharacterized protein LOC108070851 [Drosophila kikkawai]
MSTSILATMCAERLTKILVRYSRAPQPTLVRNDCQSQSQSPRSLQSVNPLPRSEATVAHLKPLANGGQVSSLGKPAVKWQPLTSFSSIGQRLQQANKTEQAILRPKTEVPQLTSLSNIGQRIQQANKTEPTIMRTKTEVPPLNFTRHTDSLASKSRGFQDWKNLGSSRYSSPFASIFQGQSVPLKPFAQDSLAFHANRVYRDCY